MAIGYGMECRLVEEFPAMIKGFDHTLLLGFSLTGALSKMLSLSEDETANALAISGCTFNPLVTSRASYTYEWKGLASSAVAMGCVNNVMLAREGMTGPVSIFEGPKGYKEVFDLELKYNWSNEDFSLINKCSLKTFNAEVHTQSSLEAITDLKKKYDFATGNIELVEVTTFLTAFHITGNGAYGDRTDVFSKEQADHSLPYTIAVALLDGKVYPEQLLPDRINKHDVQELMQKVNIKTASPIHKPLILAGLLDPYTEAYPEKLCTKVCIIFKDGKKIEQKKEDYHGYYTRPLHQEDVILKFRELAKNIPEKLQDDIIATINDFENKPLAVLINLLAQIKLPAGSVVKEQINAVR